MEKKTYFGTKMEEKRIFGSNWRLKKGTKTTTTFGLITLCLIQIQAVNVTVFNSKEAE